MDKRFDGSAPDHQCSGEGVDETGHVLGGCVWVGRCFTVLSWLPAILFLAGAQACERELGSG